MRKILALILIIVSINSFGQGNSVPFIFTLPMTKHLAPDFTPLGYQYRTVRERLLAFMVDSGLHVPRYNGVPSGLRNGVNLADGLIAMDTTNGHFYGYRNSAWFRVANFSELATAGYTTLSQFVDETAWRTFYSNASGDVTPLTFGTSGQVLTSNGVSAAPTWETVTASTQTLQQVFDTEVGGSILTKNDTINSGTNQLFFTSSKTGLNAGASFNNSSSGSAIYGSSVTGAGVYATSSGGDGVVAIGQNNGVSSVSSGGNNFWGQTTTGRGLLLDNTPSSTNTIINHIRVQTRSSGTAANGIGGSIQFMNQTSTGAVPLSGALENFWEDATNASRTTQWNLTGTDNATLETFMNIQNDLVRINNNADTLSTMAYARSVGGGGGGGDVSKVGTPANNQVGVWTGDGTIEGTNDFMFDGTTLTVGSIAVPTISSTNTFTNKRWTARVGSTTSSGTPTINTDDVDIYKLTAQTADITSFTTNLSGTPVDGDILEIQVTGTASRAITWGASFVSTTTVLPVSTSGTVTLTVIFQYYTTSSYGNNKWHCVSYY